MSDTLTNRNFFNKTSDFYDEMIGFGSALERRISLIKPFLNKEKNAADFGCGTGLDSIALSKLGLNVAAFDQSPEMIKHAKKNAENFGMNINFITAGLDSVPPSAGKNFDLIISLGNTLANVDNVRLRKFFSSLNLISHPRTKFIFQILNFEKISDKNYHLIKQSETENFIIKRYYERSEEKLLFKISYSNLRTGIEEQISTRIFPHQKEDFENLFSKAGFDRVQYFGSLKLDEFDSEKSNDLIVLVTPE